MIYINLKFTITYSNEKVGILIPAFLLPYIKYRKIWTCSNFLIPNNN